MRDGHFLYNFAHISGKKLIGSSVRKFYHTCISDNEVPVKFWKLIGMRKSDPDLVQLGSGMRFRRAVI